MEDYQNCQELIDDSSLLAQASTHRPSTSKQTESQDMSMIAHRYKMSTKQIKKVPPTPPTPYVLQHGTEKDQDLTMTTQLMDLVFRENPDWSTGKLTELQKQDPLFRNVFEKIATKDPTASDFILKDGVLLKQRPPQTEDNNVPKFVICVPNQIAYQLVHDIHTSIFSLHPGHQKLSAMLRQKFYINNMGAVIQQVISNCTVCCATKAYPLRHVPYGKKIPLSGPRECVSIDICTYDSKQKHEKLKTSFLVIVDNWSLYTACAPCNQDPTSSDIVTAFTRYWLQFFGPPRFLVTDNARNMTSSQVNHFCNTLS